ncbi:MAG: hypothetical protein V2J07_03145 [Anaerolineae bacterium]|jgi:hypothetical protein|nr:hypothetical protein [Anaerolineae bacterium]
MKKLLFMYLLISMFLVGACNLPLGPTGDALTEEEAVAATMTAFVEELNSAATAQVDINEQPHSNPDAGVAGSIVQEEIPWCPAVGYVTYLPGKQQIDYYTVSSMGEESVSYYGFTDAIYQDEVIVPFGSGDPGSLSLVYYKEDANAIYQWKPVDVFTPVREQVVQPHLVSAPTSEKIAFSTVTDEGSELFVSTIEAAAFAQPLLKSTHSGSPLTPLRLLFDEAGNMIGLYITYADPTQAYADWFHYGNRLVYIDMASGVTKDILMGDWIVLDVSPTGRFAAVVDSTNDDGLVIYDINQNQFNSVPLCSGCSRAGAALIRPDDGLIAWTEEMGNDYLLRVADLSGNIIYELDSKAAPALVGTGIDAFQPKGWLSADLLLVDTGFFKNEVFVLNVATGELAWKSFGTFISLAYDPELCK